MSKLVFPSESPPVVSLFCISTLPPKALKNVELCGEKNATETEFHYKENDSTERIIQGDDLSLSRSFFSVFPLSKELFNAGDQTNDNQYQSRIEHLLDLTAQLTLDNTLFKCKNQLPRHHVEFLKSFERYLASRTFCVGHCLTLADIALYAYIGKLTGFPREILPEDAPELAIHIKRWWNYISALNPMNPKQLKMIQGAYPGFLKKSSNNRPNLKCHAAIECHVTDDPNTSYQGKLSGAVYGKVVVRFPPEPSGYLHIGHAKAALINNYYARLYGGKLILRFDDTNPAKESIEFEDSIFEDLHLLNIKPDQITHTSDYFDYFETLCTQLIEQGHFYVDNTPVEQMRNERMKGIESNCRSNTVEQNLLYWKHMKEGTPEGVRCCVRSRMDMQNPNKCLRDPVMYRCIIDIPHHVHGFKYKAYPTYDFSCPVVDALEGVTHAMRTNEYADRIPQYKWILKQANLRNIHIYEFSRLNFVNTVLSKRKLQWFVDNGYVASWEDPRFPTVRGILRRGLTVDALQEFVLEQGPSKNCNLMEWDKLWTKNKQKLDPVAPRYRAVASECCVCATIINGPNPSETKLRPLHVKNESLGTVPMTLSKKIWIEYEDAITLEPKEEITLMHWGNAIIESIDWIESRVTSISLKLNIDGDFKCTKKKLHWVSTEAYQRVILREFDHLINKKKLEDDDDLIEFCNHTSVFDTLAYTDSEVISLSPGSYLQFERRGYFRLDSPEQSIDGKIVPPVLIKIPDGRTKSMSVITSKVNEMALCKGR